MPTKEEKYSITLELNNETLKVKAATPFDALKKLHNKEDTWYFKTRGVLTITKGDKTYRKIMFIPQMRRIFFNDLNKEIFAKQLYMAVK